MGKNSRDSLRFTEEKAVRSLSDMRTFLTQKAIALAATASLIMPGIAYTESDQNNDEAGGTTMAEPLTTKSLAEYKSNYGEEPTPEGELAEDAAVHALLFARDLSREIAEGGDLVHITVQAKNKPLSGDNQDNGMTLIEEVVRRDLIKNGIAAPTIVPGNLGKGTWSDEEIQSQDLNHIEDLLNIQRQIQVIAQIRRKSNDDGDILVKQTEFAVPAYWTVPFAKSPNQPRGRLERSTEGHQGGSSKSRRSHQ